MEEVEKGRRGAAGGNLEEAGGKGEMVGENGGEEEARGKVISPQFNFKLINL